MCLVSNCSSCIKAYRNVCILFCIENKQTFYQCKRKFPNYNIHILNKILQCLTTILTLHVHNRWQPFLSATLRNVNFRYFIFLNRSLNKVLSIPIIKPSACYYIVVSKRCLLFPLYVHATICFSTRTIHIQRVVSTRLSEVKSQHNLVRTMRNIIFLSRFCDSSDITILHQSHA